MAQLRGTVLARAVRALRGTLEKQWGAAGSALREIAVRTGACLAPAACCRGRLSAPEGLLVAAEGCLVDAQGYLLLRDVKQGLGPC